MGRTILVMCVMGSLATWPRVRGLSDDYQEPEAGDTSYDWGLPPILSRNQLLDPALVNCMTELPSRLCKPSTHHRLALQIRLKRRVLGPKAEAEHMDQTTLQ